MPATVADVVLEAGREYLIVRFENGASAPASFADLEPRDRRAVERYGMEVVMDQRGGQPWRRRIKPGP